MRQGVSGVQAGRLPIQFSVLVVPWLDKTINPWSVLREGRPDQAEIYRLASRMLHRSRMERCADRGHWATDIKIN